MSAMDRRGFLAAAFGLTAAAACGVALTAATSDSAEAAVLPLGNARADAVASEAEALADKAQYIVIGRRRRRSRIVIGRRRRRRVCFRNRFGRVVCGWR